MAWSATCPLASARPPHGDTTEHLQCQRLDVQRLAKPRSVNPTVRRNRHLDSGQAVTLAKRHADGGTRGVTTRVPTGEHGAVAQETTREPFPELIAE